MLGRRTSNGPERLPLVRPGPFDPGERTSRLLFTRTFPLRTLSRAVRIPCHANDLASHRELLSHPMQVSSPGGPRRCASPTSATNSHYEHPLDCPIPDCTARLALRPVVTCEAPRPMALAPPRVKPRLTAMLQLRRRNDSPRQRWGRNPDVGEVEDPVRSWWSLDRNSSALGLYSGGVFNHTPRS